MPKYGWTHIQSTQVGIQRQQRIHKQLDHKRTRTPFPPSFLSTYLNPSFRQSSRSITCKTGRARHSRIHVTFDSLSLPRLGSFRSPVSAEPNLICFNAMQCTTLDIRARGDLCTSLCAVSLVPNHRAMQMSPLQRQMHLLKMICDVVLTLSHTLMS